MRPESPQRNITGACVFFFYRWTSMTRPLVLVLYNHPSLPGDHPDADSEHSIVDIALRMADILEAEGGFRTSLLGLKQDPAVLWTELRRRKPAVVFNLFEGN